MASLHFTPGCCNLSVTRVRSSLQLGTRVYITLDCFREGDKALVFSSPWRGIGRWSCCCSAIATFVVHSFRRRVLCRPQVCLGSIVVCGGRPFASYADDNLGRVARCSKFCPGRTSVPHGAGERWLADAPSSLCIGTTGVRSQKSSVGSPLIVYRR